MLTQYAFSLAKHFISSLVSTSEASKAYILVAVKPLL